MRELTNEARHRIAKLDPNTKFNYEEKRESKAKKIKLAPAEEKTEIIQKNAIVQRISETSIVDCLEANKENLNSSNYSVERLVQEYKRLQNSSLNQIENNVMKSNVFRTNKTTIF